MAEQSLKDKTVKGVAWSGIDNVVHFGVSFVVSIVLARLLTPDDYGLLGIIAIFTAICTALINGGFTSALIRKIDVSENDYSTAFIVNLSLSLVLYVILFLCSPLIADFFEREELVLLTRVTSLGIIIGALALVQQTRLTKAINFKTQTKITIIASLTSGICGIVLALTGFGVWALVVQNLVSQFFRTFFLWIYNQWVPALRFSKDSFRYLFGFGWKLMVSGVLDSLWTQLNQVVVGKFYSPATLGQYTRANQLAQLFSSNLTTVIQRVTYPVLSDIQDTRERLVNAYRKVIKITMFITFLMLFFLGAISEPLIITLIGEKWKEASTYLPLICIIGTFYPLHAINLNMLQVQGRSDLFLKLEVIKKIICLLPLFIGVFWGIIPMLFADVVANVICFFLNSFYSGKFLGYTPWMQLRDISESFLIMVIMSTSVFFLKYLPLSYYVILTIQIMACMIITIALCRMFKSQEYIELVSILKSYIRIKR